MQQIQQKPILPLPTEQNKKSLCRFFLRGLCIFEPQQCDFAHGIADLIYEPWNGQEVCYDYLQDNDFTQKKAKKGPRVYKNLYQFQTQKIYSLEQLKEDRIIRQEVRNLMHQQMYQEFIQVLQNHFPGSKFTETFLLRQYTRVGFNKLMTRINFKFLVAFLCDAPGSKYFQCPLIIPPLKKKQRIFLLKKAKEDQIKDFYKQVYEQTIKNNEGVVDEAMLKKRMFNAYRPNINIPPLNLYLKQLKLPFPNFLKILLGQQNIMSNIILEADNETLLASALKHLQNNQSALVNWNDIFKFLSNTHKINNGNIVNQIRPMLIEKGYLFLNFPMMNFIVHQQAQKKIDFKQNINKPQLNPYRTWQCPCKYRQIFSDKELNLQLMQEIYQQIPPKQSLDIFDIQSLMVCAPYILKSKVLGVDLEGRLRKNGYIQMIQLNNGTNTFLIDIFRMDLNGDVDAFQLTKKILRNVMVNHEILKVFHDSRHDSLALHQFMECCVVNIFDTSAVQTYKNQLETYANKKLKPKDILNKVVNVKTPGLNQILKKYNAPHGINKNKELFHSMWKKGQTSLFDMRPLDPEYREYCIKDVLDLPYLQKTMIQHMPKGLCHLISSQYIKNGYLNTQQGQQQT